MSTADLITKRETICAGPTNRAPAGSLYLYTSKARRKLDAIDRDITHNLAMKRAAEGNPVRADGYSGRQTNRR